MHSNFKVSFRFSGVTESRSDYPCSNFGQLTMCDDEYKNLNVFSELLSVYHEDTKSHVRHNYVIWTTESRLDGPCTEREPSNLLSLVHIKCDINIRSIGI